MTLFPIGTVLTMKVEKKLDEDYIATRKSAEILLHSEGIENQLPIGEVIDAFIYRDRNNDIVATPIIPTAQKGTYGWAKVVEVIPGLGVFVNIGIPRDILVSVDDLPSFENVWPQADDQLFVTLDEDKEGRLLAIPASEQVFMDRREIATVDLFNEEVSGHVYFASREGTAIFTDDQYRGFIHHTERKREPRLGELVRGRVIDVREDGTINVSLLPLKHERMSDDAEAILAALDEHGGEIPVDDYSDPSDIRDMFGFSKSAFKRAVGRLMRKKKVEQRDGKTFLIK